MLLLVYSQQKLTSPSASLFGEHRSRLWSLAATVLRGSAASGRATQPRARRWLTPGGCRLRRWLELELSENWWWTWFQWGFKFFPKASSMLGFLFSLETAWGVSTVEGRLWTEGEDGRELESKGRKGIGKSGKDGRGMGGEGARRELKVGTERGRDGGCERGGYGLVGMSDDGSGEKWGYVRAQRLHVAEGLHQWLGSMGFTTEAMDIDPLTNYVLQRKGHHPIRRILIRLRNLFPTLRPWRAVMFFFWFACPSAILPFAGALLLRYSSNLCSSSQLPTQQVASVVIC